MVLLWKNHPVGTLLLFWDLGEFNVASKTSDSRIISAFCSQDPGLGNPEFHSSEAGFYTMYDPRRKKVLFLIETFQIYFHLSINFI